MMKSTSGLTFQIVFGSWAKPAIRTGQGGYYGICLGWVSIGFVACDVEIWSANAKSIINSIESELIRQDQYIEPKRTAEEIEKLGYEYAAIQVVQPSKNLPEWDEKTKQLICRYFIEGYNKCMSYKPIQVRKSIIELEAERLAWSKEVFTEATAISSLRKLEDEILEIEDDIISGKREPMEYADALMCLFDSAGRQGILPEEIFIYFAKKLAINKERNWKKNSNNTYSHE